MSLCSIQLPLCSPTILQFDVARRCKSATKFVYNLSWCSSHCLVFCKGISLVILYLPHRSVLHHWIGKKFTQSSKTFGKTKVTYFYSCDTPPPRVIISTGVGIYWPMIEPPMDWVAAIFLPTPLSNVHSNNSVSAHLMRFELQNVTKM